MTDKEKVISLFLDIGVGFTKSGDNIELNSDDTRNTSYNFFYTEFKFDKDGTFVSVGAYE